MRFVGKVLLLVVVLGAPSARAQASDEDPTDRDSLIDKGLQLRREHRDSEALEVFKKTVKVYPSPRARAQVALAEQALGQWVAAERDLRDALRAADDPWIKSHKAALSGALEALGKHLGTVVLKTNVTPAEVFLNDAFVGELPMENLRVPAGQVRIDLRAKGYERASRTIDVTAESTVTEEINLVADPPPAAPAAPPVDAAPAVVIPAGVAPADPTVSKPSREPLSPAAQTRRAFAWGTLGAAGAFLGGAIAAQIVSEVKKAHYNDDSECFYGDVPREVRCGVYRGQAESAQTLATFGYVASGVSAIASAVLFFAFPNQPKSSDVTLHVDFDRSHATVSIGGRL
jgi:tetratricopeptide (TPR) repeat protein